MRENKVDSDPAGRKEAWHVMATYFLHIYIYPRFRFLSSSPSSLRLITLVHEMEVPVARKMVVRPGKKARTGPEVNQYPASCPYALYFDALPQEILDNVLKFLSRLPHALSWGKHISLSDVVVLYIAIGDLGTFLCRFHTLCISKTIDCVDERRQYKWKVPREGVLWTDSIDVAHDFVLGTAGESLRAIFIGDGMYDELRNGRDLVDNFVDACPNVRSLSIVEKCGGWASAFAMQVERLEVVSNNPECAIPNYCPALVELNLCNKSNYANDFPYLHISGINWDHVGTKLESLTLTGFLHSEDELNRIRMACKGLKHIDIWSLSALQDTRKISEFIASYGGQLKYIHIYEIKEGELSHLAATCRNARFHAKIFTDHLLQPTLRILGPRLEGLSIRHQPDGMATTEWIHVWNLCPNLRVLRANGLISGEFRAILGMPKLKLKEIRIFNRDLRLERIMNTIAKGTQNVEILEFADYDPPLGAIDKFIDKNKDTLRSISITDISDELSSPAVVTKMVAKFLECPLLQDVSLDEFPSRILLNALRKRGIYFR